jgi:hypothetical protein
MASSPDAVAINDLGPWDLENERDNGWSHHFCRPQIFEINIPVYIIDSATMIST